MPTRRFLLIACLLCSRCFVLGTYAQPTQDQVRARLLNQRYFLRLLCKEDVVRYDGQGDLVSSCTPEPFTLNMLLIDDVSTKPDKLVLMAHRVGITFKDGRMNLVSLRDIHVPGASGTLRVEVLAPSGGDYGPAVDRILVSALADLYPQVPAYWHTYFRKHFVPQGWQPTTPDALPPDSSEQIEKVGRQTGVTAPKATHVVDTLVNAYAKAVRLDGQTLVEFIVHADGSIDPPSIVEPLGLGEDEEALRAVSQYRFNPAMKNGNPVAVRMRVAVRISVF